MLAGWSLRTRLVVVVAIALLPVLALAAWYAVREQRASELRRAEMVTAAAETVATQLRLEPKATELLLNALVSLELLHKRGEAFTLTETAANYLVKS